MQTVRHTIFGAGEVIAKESSVNSTKITVLFEDGQKKTFCIPDSFMIGVMTAEGDLKDEVETAIAERKALELKRIEQARLEDEARRIAGSGAGHRAAGRHVTVSRGAIETAYEAYLINEGYAIETPSGYRSTVYSYISAIERHVLDSEHITWEKLKENIDSIVKRYDVGGAKEDIGSISKFTVINALKRFKDFVNP